MQTQDNLSTFHSLYETFKQTDLFAAMAGMVENNDWHLEANVGVHTDMVVNEYLSRIDGDMSHEQLLGAIACMLHDIGKPVVCTEIIKDDGSIRLTSPGHELESARLAEDYLVSMWDELPTTLTPTDIFRICWLIQNHLFYRITKKQKLKDLRTTSRYIVSGLIKDDDKFDDIFVRCITADAMGRIGVDNDATKSQLDSWVDAYNAIDIAQPIVTHDQPLMIVMIGPSGVGKSTYVKRHVPHFTHYSWDSLRVHMFKDLAPRYMTSELDIYNFCWQQSVSDEHEKTFRAYQIDELRNIVNAKQNVVIDNTNLSSKARNSVIQQARQKGYAVIGVTFPITMEMLTQRLADRSDRDMDPEIVINMYKRLTLPSVGHWFDGIQVSDGNLWQSITNTTKT